MPEVASLQGRDHVEADRLLEAERQTRPDRADDVGSAALLTVLGVVQGIVVPWVDETNCADTGTDGTRLRRRSRRTASTPGCLARLRTCAG